METTQLSSQGQITIPKMITVRNFIHLTKNLLKNLKTYLIVSLKDQIRLYIVGWVRWG